jgi:hypothetical protein
MRITEECGLLYKVEAEYKIPAAPIIRQLVHYASSPLPDVFPPAPPRTKFTWPASGEVNLSHYWKNYDRTR